MAKKYLGKDAARDIWVRAGMSKVVSNNHSPSCTRYMNLVSKPGWMETGQIDVCRGCHLVWFKPDSHPEVPHPEDLIIAQGDSTLLSDRSKTISNYLLEKDKKEFEDSEYLSDKGIHPLNMLIGIFGIPIEISYKQRQYIDWCTHIVIGLCILLHLTVSNNLILNFSFIPEQAFRLTGFTWLSANFLHGGWMHLITNIYFFKMFGDDVEDVLGKAKYIAFIVCACIFSNLLVFLFSSNTQTPHIGLSGVVMAAGILFSFFSKKSHGIFTSRLTWYKN